MTVLQIALIVCAVVVLWLSAIALIVVWVMGMSRNAALDERIFRRRAQLAEEPDESAPSTASDRTSAQAFRGRPGNAATSHRHSGPSRGLP